MPVIPIRPHQQPNRRGVTTEPNRTALQPPPGAPAEPWALMAAAQIHSEGRLIQPDLPPGSGPSVDLAAHNDWHANG